MSPLRARVYRNLHPAAITPWQVEIELTSWDNSRPSTTAAAAAPSWPEAMQLAYLLLHDLDRSLMDDVHESRASRRVPRCLECGDPVPAGKAHWKINEGPCMILDAETIDPDTAEATA